MNKKDTHNIFVDWGKQNSKVPENNLVLKSEMLSKLPFVPKVQSRRPTPWLSLTFATLAIFAFFGSAVDYRTKGLEMTSSAVPQGASVDGVSMSPTSPAIYPDYYREYNPSIKDDRQFLKTSYNSTIRTRNIMDSVSRIEIVVRGFDGRIDSKSSGEEYGYVSFVIPASKLEMFREEIKSLTGKKLIAEQISAENLLPQKQFIEEQQKQFEKSLVDLQNERTQLIKNNTIARNSYNGRISSKNLEINNLQNEWYNASPERRLQINLQISQLQNEKSDLQVALDNQNRTYNNKLANIDSNIKSYESNLDSVKNQDKTLLDNVATVNGSISLEKVNLWEIADIYVPGSLLAWLLLAVALVSYWRYRMSYLFV